MARIPDVEMDRLKREVSVVRLVEDAGIVLKKHGKDYLGLCPFHADKEPSLVVSPGNNLWHCLGACQCGGSVIDWVMKWNSVGNGADYKTLSVTFDAYGSQDLMNHSLYLYAGQPSVRQFLGWSTAPTKPLVESWVTSP